MTAILLVTFYAFAPPLLLWRYYRLAGHGAVWDWAMAINVGVNGVAAALFAWDEAFAIEPGQVGHALLDWIGWAALGLTTLMALILALKPWPESAPVARRRTRRAAGGGRTEPVVSAPKKRSAP